MFDAGGQPLASLDARQVQIIISDDRGVPLDAVLGRRVRRGRKGKAGRRQRRRKQHERSEEHTPELQSLMRISSAALCLKKTKQQTERSQQTSMTTNSAYD